MRLCEDCGVRPIRPIALQFGGAPLCEQCYRKANRLLAGMFGGRGDDSQSQDAPHNNPFAGLGELIKDEVTE